MTNSLPRAFALLAAAMLLHGCGGSSSAANPANSPSGGASGPPTVDSKGCTAYGDPPRPLAPLSPDGLLNDAISTLANICTLNNGSMLHDYTDSEGSTRYACLIEPANASKQAPLPMLVYLHPTLLGLDSIALTGFLDLMKSANLSGDPARPGFVLLMPLGRNIQQFLPAPLNTGVGWDHWYRNTDRNSPYLNVDFASIDHYIAEAKASGVVDGKRVYLTGWSEGADFGSLYGLNTPGIAATGVFSTVTPFADQSDPCPGPAFATNDTRPYYEMARACDIGGACPGEQAFLGDLKNGVLKPSLVGGVILDASTKPVQQCNAACDPGTAAGDVLGQQQHISWPTAWNDTLLQYFQQNPQP